MKASVRVLTVALLSAVIPAVALAAKGERKKKDKNQPAATAVSFATADKYSDGGVTESEYTVAMKASLDEGSAKLRFGTLDKDHDGKLTKDEYGTGDADTGEKKKRRKKDKE